MFASAYESNALETIAVMELIREERKKSVSVREWKHRLFGYGYAVVHTDHGEMIENLSSHEEICEVPQELLH